MKRSKMKSALALTVFTLSAHYGTARPAYIDDGYSEAGSYSGQIAGLQQRAQNDLFISNSSRSSLMQAVLNCLASVITSDNSAAAVDSTRLTEIKNSCFEEAKKLASGELLESSPRTSELRDSIRLNTQSVPESKKSVFTTLICLRDRTKPTTVEILTGANKSRMDVEIDRDFAALNACGFTIHKGTQHSVGIDESAEARFEQSSIRFKRNELSRRLYMMAHCSIVTYRNQTALRAADIVQLCETAIKTMTDRKRSVEYNLLPNRFRIANPSATLSNDMSEYLRCLSDITKGRTYLGKTDEQILRGCAGLPIESNKDGAINPALLREPVTPY